jgi:hypothetical protein
MCSWGRFPVSVERIFTLENAHHGTLPEVIRPVVTHERGRKRTGKTLPSGSKRKSLLLDREKSKLNLIEKVWVSSHHQSTSLEFPGFVNKQ